jgi:hypothetical protein
MNVITIIAGLILLFAGRKLYWLFVAVIGFIAGYFLAGQILTQTSTILLIILGLVVGAIGAVLSFFLHQLVIGVAAFVGGGLLALRIIDIIGLGNFEFSWIPFIIGGLFGAILITAVFDWALIILSSLSGAFLISSGTNSNISWSNLAILTLIIIGVFIQTSLILRERAQPSN